MPSAPTARNFDDWVSLYYDHALNADELKQFDTMLAESPAQAERFLELSALHAGLCEIAKLSPVQAGAVPPKNPAPVSLERTPPSRLSRWPILDAIVVAAAIILIVVIVAKMHSSQSVVVTPQPQVAEDSGLPEHKAAPVEGPSANAWPMYRGSASLSGVSAVTVPDKPELLWKVQTAGTIKGSPAIAAGKVFIGSADGSFCCFALEDGRKIWEFSANGGIESSPCVANNTVYVGSLDHSLYALDADSGVKKWVYATGGEIKSSPVFSGGKVLIGSNDNKLHCVDAAMGHALWALETTNFINASPAVSGNAIVCGGCDGNLHVIELDSGKEIRAIEVGAPIPASAAFVNGVAYLGDYGNEAVAIDVKQGQFLWRFQDPDHAPFFSSPAVTENKVIIGGRDNAVHCLMRNTGQQLWSFNTRGSVDSSPLAVNNRVIVGSDDGRVYLLALADGTELWHYEIGSAISGSAAAVDGIFVIGAGDGTLYAFGKKKVAEPLPPPAPAEDNLASATRGWRRDGTGRFPDATPVIEWGEKKNVKWRTMVGASHSTPIVTGDRVFVTSERSTLTCLDRATGKILWKKTHGGDDMPAEFNKTVKDTLAGTATAGFATPTPVCDSEAVYVVFGSGVVCRYDFNGNRKWLRYIPPVGLGYGQSSSPLLIDGKLIVSLDGFAALDAQTGKTIWENKDIDKAYGSPVAMILGAKHLLVTPCGSVVRIADGQILLKDIAPDLSGDEFSISPIVQGDMIYFIDRTCTAVKLQLAGVQIQAKTIWSTDLEESAYASPVFHEGMIFTCGKFARYTVLDANHGKPLLDKVLQLAPAGGQSQEMANARVYPSLSIAGDKLFVSNDQGQTFVLKPAKDYVELHRNQLPEGSGASPYFDGVEIFLRGGDYLYCIGQ